MQKINWDKFKVINGDYRKEFELLSYFLFCRRFKRDAGIFRYRDQIGIETEPIQENQKVIGFQAKWFESRIKKDSITESISKAKEKNPKLTKIHFYINQEFSESKKKGKKESELKKAIEDHASAQKVEIEWVVPSNFEQLLNQPANLDLAQIYFDFSDEFVFIRACSDSKILTFLQSSEYIELPFLNLKTKNLEDITKSILKGSQTIFLIVGHPGAGKSISIHRLFQVLSGLDKNDLKDIRNVLEQNKAVPMLINLKNCTFDTIENIIRNRQNDYKLRNSKLGFIYLLDGIDELSPEKADHILSYLYELEKNETTKRIIISCRSGNLNRLKVKTFFTDISEYKIDNLTDDHLVKYFMGRNLGQKSKLLVKLRRKNHKLLAEAKDILLIKLLWDTIENLDENSTILDLMNRKVKLLIDEPKYKKNIEELNLLNPKENKIIELNQEISFFFQSKYQFRLSQKEIQNIILNKYPRIDYKSANVILNYLATLFFDGYLPTSHDEPDNTTFVYQHRRYQDFFFIQHLAKVYETNAKVLREFKVLSNPDFFENLFLHYMRNSYKRDKNLPGIVELNLIDVYLGNRNDFGADNPYYQDSPEFISSLAIQVDIVWGELLEDENLMIKEKISLDLNEVKSTFESWINDKTNWRLTEYLKSVWSGGISFLLKNIVVFWSFNKKETANELKRVLDEIIGLFKKYNFHKNLKENDHLDDPFWNKWEDYIYLRIVINKENPSEILSKLIRGNYKNFPDDKNYTLNEEGKEKLIKSFLRVCINNKQNILPQIIDSLNDEELLMLLDVLVSERNLPFLINNLSISQKIKSKVDNINAKNIHLLFCKKLFGIKITEEEKKFAEELLKNLREKRSVDWRMYKTHVDFAVVSYVLDQHSFEEYLKPQKDISLKYYNEIGLYAALFRDYIELLRSNKNIEAIARDYIRYINFYTEIYDRKYLKAEMSFLWAHIFINSNTEQQKLASIKKRLITEENNLMPFNFCLRLQSLDQNLFVKLVNISELQIFEDKLQGWNDDFPSYVSHCFDLSSFYAHLDKQKAISYIAKGINEGVVRHGWRKDIIVSYLLVEALEILWRNNWATKSELREYTRRVFELAFRVSKITDGAETREGPYNVIDLVSRHEIEFAIELKNELKKKKSGNVSNLVISSILIGKIDLGLPIEEIEEGMKEYTKNYRYDNKPDPDYYEQKFRTYLSIAESDFYTQEERKKAFETAYDQVEEAKKHAIDYFLPDVYFEGVKKSFVKLCKKYGKPVKISFDKNDDYRREVKISESNFIKEIKRVKTRQKIAGLYKILNNYNNGIVLTKRESWKLLVEQTYALNKNIKLFIELLRKNGFPHAAFYTANSKYFHFGLAAALDNINIKEEIMDYLFNKTTGHGGFVNIMKSYEVNQNKEMCLRLFSRYLRFCDFLVN
jgi:hypothetical protein